MKNGTKGFKIELQKLESNFVLYKGAKNEIGLYFSDEVDENYDKWIKTFSEEEITKAAKKMRSMLFGKISQLPMICPGANSCVYKHTCPFKPKEPTGQMCPVESALVIDKLDGYREELVLSGFKETDYSLVSRLIELELLDMRASAMAGNPEYQKPLLKQVIGVSKENQPIEQELANPIYDLKEKISREKIKILSVLVETPEARYKKQIALKEVSSDAYAQTLKDLNTLLHEAEKKLIGNENGNN